MISSNTPGLPVLHGDQIESLAAEINAYVQGDLGIGPPVPPGSHWEPQACRDFLELAITKFSWNQKGQVDHDRFESGQDGWRRITEGYPAVFSR